MAKYSPASLSVIEQGSTAPELCLMLENGWILSWMFCSREWMDLLTEEHSTAVNYRSSAYSKEEK